MTVATGADNQNEADVFGHEHGGIFIVRDNDTQERLKGRRFDAAGQPTRRQRHR